MDVSSLAHPILPQEVAQQLESAVLRSDSDEWAAMQRAGQGVAEAIILDYQELRPVPERLRILALLGKGHNSGDAVIACGHLLAAYPRARVELLLTAPEEEFRANTARAMKQLEGRVGIHRVEEGSVEGLVSKIDAISEGKGFQVCIDGIFGMNFRPPLAGIPDLLIQAINQYDKIDLRAAVDIPSGAELETKSRFRADFTYATGIAKTRLFEGLATCGRLRYVDIGFFDTPESKKFTSKEFILHAKALRSINRLRSPDVDKRSFGHLLVVGGSAYMPGALLMAVQAAVRSGVGLVTAFAPESVAASLSAQVPEAMWIPWPETENGTLSPRAMPLLLERVSSASAVLAGPGMGMDRHTEQLVVEMVDKVQCPLIFDADGLRSRVVEIAKNRRRNFGEVVVTPHMGEFMRIAKIGEPDYRVSTLLEFSKIYNVITVLKGPHTRVCDGENVLYSSAGGPVLSRGGSGDILAGLIAGMVAQSSDRALSAVARGIMLHGLAAQELAREKGQILVKITQMLDYLPKVLRSHVSISLPK